MSYPRSLYRLTHTGFKLWKVKNKVKEVEVKEFHDTKASAPYSDRSELWDS